MKNFLLLFWLQVILGHSYMCVDIHFTPYAGAENMIFLQQGIEKIDNLIYPPPVISLDDLKNRNSCPDLSRNQIWIRQAKTILFWLPIEASCVVTQHEVFGHGYRVRDLGTEYAKVTGYKMYVIGGETSLKITNQLTVSQSLAIDIAGLEADAILANRVRFQALNSGYIEGRQGLLYLMSSLTLPGYAVSVHENPKSVPENGNDISNFLFFLNSLYQDSYLSYTKTRNLSFLNLLDPFVYNSILALWIKDAFCLPAKLFMFDFGPVRYLPSTKLMLTPFGLQGYFENFFLINSIPTYLYFKWGQNGPNQYWGVGVENQKIIHWKSGSLGFRLNIWNQPHVLFPQGALSVQEIYELSPGTPIPPLYPSSVLEAKSFGVAFSLMGAQNLGKWPLTLYAELGYKTAGYLPGEALRESPIARGGLAGRF